MKAKHLSCNLIEYGALAQVVEHLTFNQVVRGSNPRCFTLKKYCRMTVLFLCKSRRVKNSTYSQNHSCNLYDLLCEIFVPNLVVVAGYDALIRDKFPTNCDAHLAESIFQTRSNNEMLLCN